jgi:hypothetical protein
MIIMDNVTAENSRESVTDTSAVPILRIYIYIIREGRVN